MRESFTYGSVGRALRKQCLYPEHDRLLHRRINHLSSATIHHLKTFCGKHRLPVSFSLFANISKFGCKAPDSIESLRPKNGLV